MEKQFWDNWKFKKWQAKDKFKSGFLTQQILRSRRHELFGERGANWFLIMEAIWKEYHLSLTNVTESKGHYLTFTNQFQETESVPTSLR